MNKQSVVNARNPLAVDSTQTLRALTPPELQASNQLQWLVVQLAISDQPINLDTMPRLEVFASYRLYTVAGRQGTSTRYALRLGFFNDEVSANALCGFLKTFFASPSVVRVSAAEQARFVEPSRPALTAAPNAKTVALAPKPVASSTIGKQAGPIVKRSVQPQKPTASGSQRLVKKPRSLAQELMDEARQVQMAKTGRFRVPERSGSWLSRLLGGSKS